MKTLIFIVLLFLGSVGWGSAPVRLTCQSEANILIGQIKVTTPSEGVEIFSTQFTYADGQIKSFTGQRKAGALQSLKNGEELALVLTSGQSIILMGGISHSAILLLSKNAKGGYAGDLAMDSAVYQLTCK